MRRSGASPARSSTAILCRSFCAWKWTSETSRSHLHRGARHCRTDASLRSARNGVLVDSPAGEGRTVNLIHYRCANLRDSAFAETGASPSGSGLGLAGRNQVLPLVLAPTVTTRRSPRIEVILSTVRMPAARGGSGLAGCRSISLLTNAPTTQQPLGPLRRRGG